MLFLFQRCLPALLLAMHLATSLTAAEATQSPSVENGPSVDYGTEVRPILAKHCFACHGPDENTREAGLRLDTQAGSREDLGGYQAVLPGSAEDSEVMLRVTSEDPDMRMPPADSHPPLSEQEVATLRAWINAGGEYEMHWAFKRPTRPQIPDVSDAGWCRGPIDRFVLHRLEQAGLAPGKAADQATLLRRVYLDLIGIPPTPEETKRYLSDSRPDAYRRVVDRLLASPEYGQRFARPWLDLARYSDTNGYEKDRPRTIWPYRDWVINAINEDKPFDAFTIEQLAGDMLPDATRQQRIATGFHRNTMLNEEGGIDPLEYRFYALVDRVATTGTVWMGLTVGCAQCHTHKYDPITHTDYYSMMALMDNADEPELNADSEAVRAKRAALEAEIAAKQNQIIEQTLLSDQADPEQQKAFRDWQRQQIESVARWQTIAPTQVQSTMPRLVVQEDGSVLASGDATKRDVYTLTMPPIESDRPVTAIRIEALPHASLPATGPGLAFYEGRRGDFFLSELKINAETQTIQLGVGTTSVPGAKAGNGKTYPGNVLDGDGSTGWSIPGQSGQTHHLVIPLETPQRLDSQWTIEMLFERHYVAGLGHFRIDVTTDAAPKALPISTEVQEIFATVTDTEQLNESQTKQVAREFLSTSKAMASQRKPIDRLRQQLPQAVRTLVMRERPESNQRTTHRHHRGEYLQPKEVVSPSIPEVFEIGDGDEVTNRLEMARWLVSERNPLVGRVTANRAWRTFFGTGIVRTAGDFGTQSESPSHPDLIDWLAVWFQDESPSGANWSMKRLHRAIVLSSTYRLATGNAPESDPNNRLLSTFPYRRLDAERIRDSFLAAAGLLSHKVGGPSVYPPQPMEVVKMAYGNPAWPTSKGEDRYRRSLYTFSKRTAPFAAFATFDAPSGENCIARRDTSTTPLQALTLLNDEMYLEIADAMAEDVLREFRDESPDGNEQPAPRQIAKRLFRRLLVRSPEPSELDAIVRFYKKQSEHPRPWMLVARVLMNTDEAITTP
jgi:mono/diheme cytochrome c family protein